MSIYDYKTSLYSFFNPIISKFVPSHSKVLDVGCGAGQLGELLIKEKKCIVYGVDISSVAIHTARKVLHKAAVCDIEREELPFKNNYFDVLIFGDLLEHLREPEKVLLSYKEYIKKEGILIASIPNIANIRIRLRLLMGQWNYKPVGILDDTHLRFFTYNSMVSMFKRVGFSILDYDSLPGFDFGLSRRFKIFKPITDKICRLRPTLFANQFVFLLKNESNNSL